MLCYYKKRVIHFLQLRTPNGSEYFIFITHLVARGQQCNKNHDMAPYSIL